MKCKNKRWKSLVSMLLLCCICMSMIAVFPVSVSAATTTPYYKTYGSYYKVNSGDPNVPGSPEHYDIYMYGSSTSGSGTLNDYANINWDNVTIYLDSHQNYDFGVHFSIKKDGTDYSYSNLIDSGNSDRVLYSGSLPDGSYEISYLSHKEEHFLIVYWPKEYAYYYHFTVDTTAPKITGASSSTVYRNGGFTVSASDERSGINRFLYAEPGDQYFKTASGTSVTIPAGSAQGYYHFKAYDNAGNESDYCYVYYDTTNPIGTIKNSSNTELTGTYTNTAFKYVASDLGSGINYSQYKTPGSSTWLTYSSGATISKTNGDGYYQFRCVDRAGNYSLTKSIYLDATAPTGTLYAGSQAVTSGSGVVGTTCKFIASDNLSGVKNCYVKKPGSSSYESYTSGNTLTGYGTYYFYCTDYAGNISSTYSVTLMRAAEQYTVSYNANGGSNAPASQIKTEGTPLTLTTAQPTRTGYTFLGWSTSSTAIAPSYLSGGTYSTDASVTMYAVWEAKRYTVTYDANGGNGAPASHSKNHGTALTIPYVTPTRSGYSFVGWATSPSAAYATYYPGSTFAGNYDITLYAVWSRNPNVYTISYDANGGSDAPSAQSKTEGVATTLSSVAPTRKYYTFLGWGTTSSATVPAYQPGDVYSVNSSITLYAIWEYAPETYTVRYNANGGSGAPSSQVKTEDIDLILSTVEPTRFRYTFKGWSSSSLASEPEYLPGDTYTANVSTTLYAVWEKDNYEFSVSNLTVVEDPVYRYDTATVKVRADSWDRVNAYDHIPIQLYYDGRLIGTQYANFAAYGIANVTFTVNVGDTPGDHTLEVRINWEDRTYETDSTNNSVSGTITVKNYEYEVSPHPVEVSADYIVGTTVVTSFTVDNDSDFDITPDLNHKLAFTAYYYDGARKVVISTQTWEQAIIPSRGSNLFYFQWTVPSGIAGKTVYCECTANADGALNEENRSNNTVIYTKVVQAPADSQTPNTRYEANAPVDYYQASAPLTATQTATWNRWEYEGGAFVLKQYGVKPSADIPVITPGNSVSSAYYENGKWVMKSGYGITLIFTPDVTRVAGYSMPDSNAYTPAQSAVAYFPEYCYSTDDGEYRILEYANGSFQFVVNRESSGLERLHFVPIYVADGNYVVSVIASEIWTPVGMITAVRNSNAVIVDGTIYDDYYVGT